MLYIKLLIKCKKMVMDICVQERENQGFFFPDFDENPDTVYIVFPIKY